MSDGGHIWLGEDSDFQVLRQHSHAQIIGQMLLDELFGGSIHIIHDPRIDAIMGVQGSNEGTRFKAVFTVVAVRGTEFGL